MRIHLTNSRERLRMAQEAAQQKAKTDAAAGQAAPAP
jgi:GntR family transcriptional repressor for pyruvate dehydrogenase complex